MQAQAHNFDTHRSFMETVDLMIDGREDGYLDWSTLEEVKQVEFIFGPMINDFHRGLMEALLEAIAWTHDEDRLEDIIARLRDAQDIYEWGTLFEYRTLHEMA